MLGLCSLLTVDALNDAMQCIYKPLKGSSKRISGYHDMFTDSEMFITSRYASTSPSTSSPVSAAQTG